ncbi:hypothetical protein BDF22DRAFT_654939 [Syncephalis plumigaleata]|nr:hypothetical protein BDF22DRAFT_654939 [Syncephalis plumigaleata]
MDQYGVKAASNESTPDISFIKIAALIEKTWQVKISPSEVATSSDKYHWLTQQLERMTTTTVQVQTLMRILIIWSSDAQEDRMSAEECLDIWCRLFGWMITQEMYTWCYATRLFLYTQSDMDLDELDRRVLDQLAAATTGHLPYLLYCLLASDSQLVAKAVTDIRSDLNDTDKAAQLVSNDDLPILLCARSIITELATTSLMTSVIHRLFVCSCGDTSRNRHAWRRLLIGQVALNMELVGYDELSADIATRYLGIPSCVDSLSRTTSDGTAAIKAEHEAQADRWQPPIIYQLDDNMDRHTLHHWIVRQFMQ